MKPILFPSLLLCLLVRTPRAQNIRDRRLENCAEDCQNGGECVYDNFENSNICDCSKAQTDIGGYEGEQCQLNFRACNDHNGKSWKCYNRAVCGEDGACTCANGFSGRYCRSGEDSGSCNTKCLNGGECKNGSCDCKTVIEGGEAVRGYEGDQCETQFILCDDENSRKWKCFNRGVCNSDGSCTCKDYNEYGGKKCNKKVEGGTAANFEDGSVLAFDSSSGDFSENVDTSSSSSYESADDDFHTYSDDTLKNERTKTELKSGGKRTDSKQKLGPWTTFGFFAAILLPLVLVATAMIWNMNSLKRKRNEAEDTSETIANSTPGVVDATEMEEIPISPENKVI